MLGSRLYYGLTRHNFLFGNLLFAGGYAYIAGIYLMIFTQGPAAFINLNNNVIMWEHLLPQAVWLSLYNYWNYWFEYKDLLNRTVWSQLFVAMSLPFFTLRIIEVVCIFCTRAVLSIFGYEPPKVETEEERFAREQREEQAQRNSLKEELKEEIRETIRKEMQGTPMEPSGGEEKPPVLRDEDDNLPPGTRFHPTD